MNKKIHTIVSHPSEDEILSVLSAYLGLIGEFVKKYPGKEFLDTSPTWVEEWFQERVEKHNEDKNIEQIKLKKFESWTETIVKDKDVSISKPVKIISIQPNWFRGFRKVPYAIDLTGNLIVIDGRNSSGKTSLAEAFEWCLTGELLRRSMNLYGDPGELEGCITNQLKPDDEETWVEAKFQTSEGVITIRRVLLQDYGRTATSLPKSVLYVNGEELGKEAENIFFDNLFASVPPILMQHSLRLFVHSSPSERRDYFERLLRLDEMTYLIEKAVIGNARLAEFPSPTKSVALKAWERLIENVGEESKKTLRAAERKKTEELLNAIRNALEKSGRLEFSDVLEDESSISDIRTKIEDIQKDVRQSSFPLLDTLRPKEVIDDELKIMFTGEHVKQSFDELKTSYSVHLKAQKAAKSVGEAQLVIAKAVGELSNAGLIQEDDDSQICPVCDYQEIKSLSKKRVLEIQSWQPIQEAAASAQNQFEADKQNLKEILLELKEKRENLLPAVPSDDDIKEIPTGTLLKFIETAKTCIQTLKDCHKKVKRFDDVLNNLIEILEKTEISKEDLESSKDNVNEVISNLSSLLKEGNKYIGIFSELDSVVNSIAREDPAYNLRELWLEASEDQRAIEGDLAWEKSKKKAQKELERIRKALIYMRKRILDQRRSEFSGGITTVWQKLRSDRYSSFNQLYIPEPSGRGFPVKIEVKAMLDDGSKQVEVDALRVFSESQINVLGIAAFATRSKILGHRLLILDDPVQSMDEDHFKTFATELLPELLSFDTQVIILTHNDTFAREISYAWYGMENYVTMAIRHSRRKGCQVDEGNRRVSERLNLAEKRGEDGKYNEAWRFIRLTIERMYTVTYIKHGPATFKPESWRDHAAEYMWDDGSDGGVGNIFQKLVPDQTKRLQEILKMSVVGAHDKNAYGETDLMNAIDDLKKMLIPLKIGAG